ncbi:MAG: hypothetical protein KME51_13560 [Candidatus Thiodiazotropha sp. (ex Ctena orbiculata)]|nr:hypothetical protein [Candidatus Thiodiazotropha taylori]
MDGIIQLSVAELECTTEEIVNAIGMPDQYCNNINALHAIIKREICLDHDIGQYGHSGSIPLGTRRSPPLLSHGLISNPAVRGRENACTANPHRPVILAFSFDSGCKMVVYDA